MGSKREAQWTSLMHDLFSHISRNKMGLYVADVYKLSLFYFPVPRMLLRLHMSLSVVKGS